MAVVHAKEDMLRRSERLHEIYDKDTVQRAIRKEAFLQERKALGDVLLQAQTRSLYDALKRQDAVSESRQVEVLR